MKNISITTEYIKLDQFLKFTGEAADGGEARHLIFEGNVIVNGDIEKRRGKKLRSGDIVEVKGSKYSIE